MAITALCFLIDRFLTGCVRYRLWGDPPDHFVEEDGHMIAAPRRGTGALWILMLASALGAMAPATGFALCPGGACSAPGGGSLTTDCMVEFDGVMLNNPPTRPRGVICTDGDPACDLDAAPNGVCNFKLTACLNNPDPRFPGCVAPNVQSITIKNRPPTSASYNAQLAAMQSAVQALVPTSSNVCTGEQSISVPLRLRNLIFRPNTVKVRSLALSSTGTKDTDRVKLKCIPSPSRPGFNSPFARAEVMTNPNQLIQGPLAFGTLGDLRIYNERIQVVIQKPGRKAAAIDIYGGNIVDADRIRPDGTEHDHFGAWAPGINVENTANYTSVTVLNDGSNGSPAVIRATGPDDLMDFVNPSSVVAGFGFAFPPSADDQDLPIDVQTDYTLAANTDYVRVDTTITNQSAAPLAIYFADYLNGSGQVDLWQPTYGFGEPLVTTRDSTSAYVPCTANGTCDPQNMVAYVGVDGAKGVSYGYVTPVNGTTSFSTSGVTVPLIGLEAVFTLIGASPPNFNMAANGNPGDAITFTRYFIVAGDFGVAEVEGIRNQILGVSTLGNLRGTVTSGGQPVADADIVVTAPPMGGPLGSPSTNSVNHTRTQADGTYYMSMPAGSSYTVRANKNGRLAASPASAPVTITAGGNTIQDFTVPAAGAIRVLVTDENNLPIPAKVQLVGSDPSPDPRSSQSILGLINSTMGIFGEEFEDGFVHGIANVTFAGVNGDTGVFETEPGTYQLAVSRGPRYSAFLQNVTINAGATTTVNAQLAKVVNTPGFITGDFHVHGILSPDSEVTLEERITTQLAEGSDFFTPSEHEIQADYSPTVQAMGAQNLIATAVSSEITTFDYGHFNSWPKTIDPSAVNGGSVDWGRAGVAPGQDYPSLGNYSRSPQEIYATAHADPKANLIQINHMRSHFNTDGLDIDTAELGVGPPTSHTPGAARRLNPSISNYFDDGFDALEVWIGTDGRTGDQQHFVGENLGDWFNMINQGILSSGVADSDTHQRRTTQINARTYVASAVTNPALLWSEDENLAQSIVMGHATGTNAPFTTITVTTPLGTAGLGVGDDTMVPTNNGTATVDVTVQSPLWAPFDKVEFYYNNAPQPYDHDNDAGTRNRYRVIPNSTVNVTPTLVNDYPSIPGAQHWTATAQLNLAGLTTDTWVVALVRGTDNVSQPLFPVIPNSLVRKACANNPCRSCNVNGDCPSSTCTVNNQSLAELTDGNLNQCGVMALAFTNPLFIDVNQNSQYDPPGVLLTP
jgi:hypothetical protein